MKERLIKRDDFLRSKWTGGETNQLAIYPEDAIFANKDFLWRISSASFTSTGSKFSDFTGYQRYILPLEGNIKLLHQGLYRRDLDVYDVEYFDGSWTTFSENSLDCIDYNFIVKSGIQAKMQLLAEGEDYKVQPLSIVTIFSTEDFQLELVSKGIRNIEGYSLLILELEDSLNLKIKRSRKPIIVTEYKIEG